MKKYRIISGSFKIGKSFVKNGDIIKGESGLKALKKAYKISFKVATNKNDVMISELNLSKAQKFLIG